MVKMTIHSPHVRWETSGTMAHLLKRPVWSAASVTSPQMAAWRWRQLSITGDLKTPMPLTAPLCGVQRQVICFPFFLVRVLCLLYLVLVLLLSPIPQEKKISTTKNHCLAKQRTKESLFEINFCSYDQDLTSVCTNKRIRNGKLKRRMVAELTQQQSGSLFIWRSFSFWRDWFISFVVSIKWDLFLFTPYLK